MHGQGFFFQAFVYLTAAVISVPIAKRLGLGSVLGYLLAGVAIGPFALGFIGAEGEDLMHFAEFGVVMMLFLVGLELEPARLWRLRGPILGLGGLQMAVTASAIGAVAWGLGLSWQMAVAVGLTVAMSSTAIGVQSLTERGLLQTDAGQKSFSVLLFQDVAVILILAVFPLLATLDVHHGGKEGHHHGPSFIDQLGPLEYAGVVLGAIVGVVLLGRFAVDPILRVIAWTRMRELFTAAALALVVGVTLIMTWVGLSPALGTFLAGVLLANSTFRHELESDIEPFKGLLLGLFFLAVGASIQIDFVISAPGTVSGLLFGIVFVKVVVLVGLGALFGARGPNLVHLATGLGQVGEFAFVLLAFAAGNGVLSPDVAQPLVAVTALSMALSPILIALGDRVVAPALARGGPRDATPEPDMVDEGNPVIIAGFGRFGQITGRFLRAHGVGATVLDIDVDQVAILRRFGQKVFYGDASRLDLLRAAGAEHARLLIVAVDESEKVLEIVHTAEKHFPHLQILARARGRTEAYDLHEAGVGHVYRETFDTAVRVGADALRMLGVPGHRAHRAALTFRKHDDRSVVEMGKVRNDQQMLVRTARERLAEVEAILRLDRDERAPEDAEPAWDASARRAHAQGGGSGTSSEGEPAGREGDVPA